MAPLYVPDDFGGHYIYPYYIEPANWAAYHQRIRQITIDGTKRNLWSDMHQEGIQDPEVLRLEAIYSTNIVRWVEEEIMEMLNSHRAYQILTTEVEKIPPSLSEGPPP